VTKNSMCCLRVPSSVASANKAWVNRLVLVLEEMAGMSQAMRAQLLLVFQKQEAGGVAGPSYASPRANFGVKYCSNPLMIVGASSPLSADNVSPLAGVERRA
jgi:hypothetical protein